MSRSTVFSLLLILILVVGAVVGIVYLKRSTARNLDVDGYLRAASDSDVATPVLSADDDPRLSPDESITVSPLAQPDTLMGTDQRQVSDAGYEDGYWDGYDDAHKGEHRMSYNESSTFSSSTERRQYAENYRDGYEEGWQAGLQHRAKADERDEHSKMPEKE